MGASVGGRGLGLARGGLTGGVLLLLFGAMGVELEFDDDVFGLFGEEGTARGQGLESLGDGGADREGLVGRGGQRCHVGEEVTIIYY